MTLDPTDRFTSTRLPLLAALATNTARPSAFGKLLAGFGVVGALLAVSLDGRGRYHLAFAVEVVVAVLAAVIAPLLASQQLFSDRQSGALDQQRLAGRGPAEVLAAYALGPSWVILALLWLSAVAASVCEPAREFGHALGVAAAATVASLAWTLGGAAFALGIDRALPLNQAGGVGVLVPLARLPIYGLVLSVAHNGGWAGLVAFELLALALSTRFALRRLSCEDDGLDRSAAPFVAIASAAAVSTLIGRASLMGSPRSLALPAVAAVALAFFTLVMLAPTRGGLFRAWLADDTGTRARLARMSALSAGLAGASVVLGRALAGGAIDLAAITAALYVVAQTAALFALRAQRDAGASPVWVGRSAIAVTLVPAGSWIASRVASPRVDSAFNTLASAAGAPFGSGDTAALFVLRAALCVGALGAAAALSSRGLHRAARAAHERMR